VFDCGGVALSEDKLSFSWEGDRQARGCVVTQRALWVAVGVFALAAIAIFALRHRARSFSCPTLADDASRQVLVENASLASSEADNITVDAYAKNNSPRALVGLTVEATLADGRILRADAHNNKAGAPLACGRADSAGRIASCSFDLSLCTHSKHPTQSVGCWLLV
jgi:hypothetical protein